MQHRRGPMEAGPAGSLQLVADGIKFIQKEDIIPRGGRQVGVRHRARASRSSRRC